MLYINEHESLAEKYCQLHHIEPPKVKSWKDCLQFLDKSRYAVERAFNSLSRFQRALLTTVANIDALQDFQRQESPVSGEKLHHYSVTGQLKIAKGLKLLRTISNAFPKGIRFSDFCHTEQKKENNNGSN